MAAFQDVVTEPRMKTTAAALKTELVSNAGSYDAQQAALARIFQNSLCAGDPLSPQACPAGPGSGAQNFGVQLTGFPLPNCQDFNSQLDPNIQRAVEDSQLLAFASPPASATLQSFPPDAFGANEPLAAWTAFQPTSSPTAAVFPGALTSPPGTPLTSPGSQFSGCDEMFETIQPGVDDATPQPFCLQRPRKAGEVDGRRASGVDTRRSSVEMNRRPSPGRQARTNSSGGKPKKGHNVVEKRYRTNLNDKLERLRESVPSLRTQSPAAGIAGVTCAASGDGSRSNNLRPNKANILEKAVEHIQQLEGGLKHASDENARLRALVRTLEKMIVSGGGVGSGAGDDETRAHLAALVDATI